MASATIKTRGNTGVSVLMSSVDKIAQGPRVGTPTSLASPGGGRPARQWRGPPYKRRLFRINAITITAMIRPTGPIPHPAPNPQ